MKDARRIGSGQRRHAPLARLKRLLRLRLVIPLQRSRHPPQHTARGVMVGLAWAMTPLVGVQMYLVVLTWLVARRLIGWDFNVVVAVVWTWVTNALTLVPAYYAFYVTGQAMLGRWDDLSGYRSFGRLLDATFGSERGLAASAQLYFEVLVVDWGVAMWVGCLPYAALFGWLGYRCGLRFMTRHAARRKRRLALRRQAWLAGRA